MTEINPPLKPTAPPTSVSPAGSRPLIPHFGFRFLAFAIDALTLYMAAYLANAALRQPLLSLGRGTVLLAMCVMVIYFTILNGPVGKGATLGKQILQMRVLTLNGDILSWNASFRRALLQTLPILGIQILQFLTWQSHLPLAGITLLQITFNLLTGLFLANGMLVLLSPLKRSMHDYQADSMVVRITGESAVTSSRIAEAIVVAPPAAPYMRVLVGATLLLPILMTLPAQVAMWRKGEYDQVRGRMQDLERRLGVPELEIRQQAARDVPTGGRAAEEAETQRIRSGEKPLVGPRTLMLSLALVSYNKLTANDLEDLRKVQDRLPAVRQWVVDSYLNAQEKSKGSPEQAKRMAEAQKRMTDGQIGGAFLELQAIEVLDLGFEFKSQPLLRVRDNFDIKQVKELGIPASRPATTKATQATTKPL